MYFFQRTYPNQIAFWKKRTRIKTVKQFSLGITPFLTLLFLCNSFFSQEQKKLKDIFEVNGYVKYMNTSSFSNLDSILTDNLIHNRINVKGYFGKNLVFNMGIRNRVFYGETVKLNPFYSQQVNHDNGLINLSFLWLDKTSIAGLTQIDRLNLKYQGKKFDLTLGRQRINWGVNLAWNPNDLFNAYNLVNFDYQERAGSDAARFQYYINENSSIEIAAAPTKYMDSSVIAMRYKINKWKYDFQFIASNFNRDIALGTGWAGNLKDAGFKGEATYFIPKYVTLKDTNGVFGTSMTFDYSLKNGIYINFSYLYNSQIPNQLNIQNSQALFAESLSAKNLMPSRHTYFGQINGAFNPIISSSFAVFYAQSLNLLFFMPSVSVNVADNWNLDLFGQTAVISNPFKHFSTGIYLRLQYSY